MSKKRIMEFFPNRLTPRTVQESALLALEKNWENANIFVVNLPVASGKCHKLGQEVLMYDGTLRKIEDVKVGDKMMGPDSGPRTVQQLHRGVEQLYTIRPTRGQEWTVTGNHILRLWRYIRPMTNNARQGQFIHEEVSVIDYLQKSADYKNNSWMQRVGVDFHGTEHNTGKAVIPPYILGLWLGDGTSTKPAITSMDLEIYNEWISYGHRAGCDMRIEHNGSRACTFNLRTERGTPNPVLQALQELNLIKNKHIPHQYLTASIPHRKSLLAGIIDTDGHVDRDKRSIEITQRNKRLADDILFLARSLGYSANQHIKIINDVEYYRCHISGQVISDLPVRLSYKRPVNSQSNQSNYKFEIIPAEVGEYAGVTVDKDSLYLLDDFTVSHNSAIAMTLAHWTKKASIITPSKLLVNQYKEEYNYVHVLRAKSDYYCDTFKCPVHKRPQTKKTGKLCKKDLGCSGCQSYLKDLRKARVLPYLLSNYHIYLAHQLYRDTLIVDEAHSLIDTLKQMSARKFWQFKHRFPDHLRTREDVKAWVNSLPEHHFNYHFQQSGDRTWTPQEGLLSLKDELNSYRPKFLVEVGEDDHRGETFKCIKMVPLDISDAPPIMWPSQVKKIVFLSATISRKDIEQLGLAGKKIQYIQADSPIHAENRPVVFAAENQSMAWKKQDESLPAFIDYLTKVAAHHEGESGLVHCTYSLAKKLRAAPIPPELRERMIFHTKSDKTAKYHEFRESGRGKILIACGMYEGIDLPYDAGRWQVIAKVPWPSLGDPAIKYLSEQDELWYSWETLKSVLQACGRICRTPEDFGATYIFDSTFKRLYDKGVEEKLIPEWFQHSVHGLD